MADLPFTLDQLRILRAIASEGSFKKAADSLYVTQPAVSLQIQNLESSSMCPCLIGAAVRRSSPKPGTYC